jgi:Tuberculosis necrotizing toxin
LRTFRVVKPFEVEEGLIAPAHGQEGKGIQYRAPVSLGTLLKWGVIQEVKDP